MGKLKRCIYLCQRHFILASVMFAILAYISPPLGYDNALAATEDLPFLSVDTHNGKDIEPEGDFSAVLTLEAGPTTQPDQFNEITTLRSPIKIKMRGNSSKKFAKKQYEIEFIDEQQEAVATSMMGLPKAEKWILTGPYVDRTLLRNALVYSVGRAIGLDRGDMWFAPNTRFIEVQLNGDYRGLYILTEKIQRGKTWVNIPKTEIEDPKKLSYIVEISSIPKGYDFKSRYGTKFEYKYPSHKKITEWTQSDPNAAAQIQEAIQDQIDELESCLKSKNFANLQNGYHSLIDVDSFVDFIIVQEVFKNNDAYTRSAYLHKAHDGKIQMGPLWDFDTAVGNLNFLGFGSPKRWVYESRFFTFKSVFWFKRLMSDPAFAAKVKQRYSNLRTGVLSEANLLAIVTQLSSQLEQAGERDAQRWHGTHGLITKFFMNTKKRGKTFADNIEVLKSWLSHRLHWVDKQWLSAK